MAKTAEIAQLAHEILKHKKLYYQGAPEITDLAYDALEEDLRKLAPWHPVLEMVGSREDLAKEPHQTPMLSLQKVYTQKELMDWAKGHDLVAMWKIDGASLSLVYTKGKLTLAKTRGNGKLGENVTEKVLWVDEIPKVLEEPLDLEIRGELFCKGERFRELAEDMEASGLEPPSNPRNIVAGILLRKTHVELSRYFSFFGFDVLGQDLSRLGIESEWGKFSFLKKNHFVAPGPRRVRLEEEIGSYLKDTERLITESDIGMDGAVFVYDSLDLQKELGATSHHPRYKMSFKWQGESACSLIESIQWATSRYGVVTPVAKIKPVQLSGAKITNVTLHNAAHVRNFHLKPGDRIEIIRSGEVIPKFLKVVQTKGGQANLPSHCPACGAGLEDDGVRLICPNTLSCKAQTIGRILNWVREVEIDDLSEKRLQAMISEGLIKDIPDLYRLTMEDLLKLPLTKEKMAAKLLTHIERSKQLSIPNFLAGLSIAGMGKTSWEKILAELGTLDRVFAADADEIANIHGFAQKTAEQIVEGLQLRRPVIEELFELGVQAQPPREPREGSSLALEGKQVAVTGKLSMPRNEIVAKIKAHGGRVVSSVTGKTDAVVTNDPSAQSSKLKKARELQLPIWSEQELMDRLAE